MQRTHDVSYPFINEDVERWLPNPGFLKADGVSERPSDAFNAKDKAPRLNIQAERDSASSAQLTS